MREATAEGRIFIAVGAALFALLCAVAVSASTMDGAIGELASPRRWVLVAFGLGINLGTLALMRQFVAPKSLAVLAIFVVLVVVSLASGFRWMQVQVPIAFWLGDILVMAVCCLVVVVRAARKRAMQPDVQSSFLASRLWK
ncbi:hypothetical protein [Ramlibacter albus]|uniref:Uncharacterized protein n=1 Tax=Ramlibacter albus TaxID=2079448 RepID=A0A923M6D4_9BURK|nr:hypothetical protein [Ramlibacter albus]MBC5764200.1 hypothetical protein [Ramlibacter albus]